MRKIYFTICVILIESTCFAQLDPLYNQYLFNQSMINPAYTGVNDVFNATVISRAQWTGIEGAPVTNMLNVTSSLVANKMGAGILVVNDRFGVSNNTEVQLAYSYRIEWINSILSMGLQGGFVNYGFRLNKLDLEQFDPALANVGDQFTKSNFGFGVYYRANNYYVGVSVPRILNVDEPNGDPNTTRYKRHYYLSAGIILDQIIAVKFKPSILLKVVDNQPSSIDLNAQVLFLETLWVGATLRNFNAVGFTGQFEIGDALRLGYSLELPLGPFSGGTKFGTHELMVSYDLELLSNHAKGRRYF